MYISSKIKKNIVFMIRLLYIIKKLKIKILKKRRSVFVKY